MRAHLKQNGHSPRKIVVNRKKTRALPQNHLDIIKELGFIEVFLEDMSFEEQSNLFFNATHIILPHGAAAANLIFCGKGCKILELNNGFNPTCFVRITKYMNLLFNLEISYCLIFNDFIMDLAELLPDDTSESEAYKIITFHQGKKRQFNEFFQLNRKIKYQIPLLKDYNMKLWKEKSFEMNQENFKKYISEFMSCVNPEMEPGRSLPF